MWEDYEAYVPELKQLTERYEDDPELIDAIHKTLAFMFTRLASLLLLNNYETQRAVMQSMETEGEEQ
jgi:hypothetical protein